MTAHVSIKDIAAKAGVSFQTVSKVLKGQGSVSAETRAWILKVAEELGYVPNALARGLISQRTSTIGIVASDFTDFVLSQFVVGAEREARRQGQSIIIGSLDQQEDDVERYIRALLERRVDGILLAAPQLEQNVHVAELLHGQVPVVSIHHVPGANFSMVGSHQSQVGRLATQHLLELGHQRIGTIIGPHERRATQSRLRGYQRALEAAGLSPTIDLVETGDWQAEGGYTATLRLLERAPDVTAIFAQNDLMAIGVLSALHERGRHVPDDCSVVGCDDIPISAYTIPPLTTVRLPIYETGEAAIRLLLDIIDQKVSEPQQVLMPAPMYLVQRASSSAHKAYSSSAVPP